MPEVLGDHQMRGLEIKAGQGAQITDRRSAIEHAGPGEGAPGDVALGEAGFGLARRDRLDVGDRALGGLDHEDQVGDAAAASLVAQPGTGRP